MKALETQRLRLEPLTRDDYDWLFGLYGDPEVMKYIAGGGRTRERTTQMLDWQLTQAQRVPYGLWVVRERASGEPLGAIALMERTPGAPVEVGFAYARSAWRRGIGRESAVAVLDHGLRELKIPEIHAYTDPLNEASKALLRSAGLIDHGVSLGPYGSMDSHFSVTRQQWLAAR